MSVDPAKKPVKKVKGNTEEGIAENHLKEEPAVTSGNGGMIGEGDSKEGTGGGMKGEQ